MNLNTHFYMSGIIQSRLLKYNFFKCETLFTKINQMVGDYIGINLFLILLYFGWILKTILLHV